MKATYVNHMGNDDSVVNAARISMDKLANMFTPEQNESLIKYLATGMSSKDKKTILRKMTSISNVEDADEMFNHISNIATHWTPFAHTAITLRMSAPVPIRTQCFKHKAGMVENEESRRYISSIPEFHFPEYIREVGENVKQGSAGKHPHSDWWEAHYINNCIDAVSLYNRMINDGVCPEQARFVLPQGTIVNWIWTGNLFSFANFFIKRTDSHAQLEIQELAKQVGDIIQPLYPISWKALTSQ